MNCVSQVYTNDQQDPCAGTQRHHSIIRGSITYDRVSFQINPDMFHMVANKYFILLLSWMLVGGQGFSSNLDHSYPGKKKNTRIC